MRFEGLLCMLASQCRQSESSILLEVECSVAILLQNEHGCRLFRGYRWTFSGRVSLPLAKASPAIRGAVALLVLLT
jgi:hypothetical protein